MKILFTFIIVCVVSCSTSTKAVAPEYDFIGTYEAYDRGLRSHDILKIMNDHKFVYFGYGEWRQDTLEGAWQLVSDTLILNSQQQARIVDASEIRLDSIKGFAITLIDTFGDQVFNLDSVHFQLDSISFKTLLHLPFDSVKKRFIPTPVHFDCSKAPIKIDIKLGGANFSYAVRDSLANSIILKLYHPSDFQYELVFRNEKYIRSCEMLFEVWRDGSVRKNYPYFRVK